MKKHIFDASLALLCVLNVSKRFNYSHMSGANGLPWPYSIDAGHECTGITILIYIYIYNDYPQDPTMDIAWVVGLAYSFREVRGIFRVPR